MREAKRKILFLMPYMGCGGVESTLLSLLEVLDKDENDITLLLLEQKGAFLDRLPDAVKVKQIQIPEREWGVFYGKKKVLASYLRSGKLWKIPPFLVYNSRNGITENRSQMARYFERISCTIPPLAEEYDLAIDYFGYATFTTFYLAEKVNARVKVSWLHSILSRFEPQEFGKWYEKMDAIFACSKMVQADFKTMFPDITNVRPFYNIIFPEKIRERSVEKGGFTDGFEGIRILTVGRICHEKGYDLAVEAYRKLLADGYNIRWYMVGGSSADVARDIKDSLRTVQEQENFVLLGIRNNPYIFMRQCDIYVQPSRFEGYCTTTNEARILGKAIVMTDVSGAREQIEDGKTGLIVQHDSAALYEAVKMLIDQSELGDIFAQRLGDVEFSTIREVEKLFVLLDK